VNRYFQRVHFVGGQAVLKSKYRPAAYFAARCKRMKVLIEAVMPFGKREVLAGLSGWVSVHAMLLVSH